MLTTQSLHKRRILSLKFKSQTKSKRRNRRRNDDYFEIVISFNNGHVLTLNFIKIFEYDLFDTYFKEQKYLQKMTKGCNMTYLV